MFTSNVSINMPSCLLVLSMKFINILFCAHAICTSNFFKTGICFTLSNSTNFFSLSQMIKTMHRCTVVRGFAWMNKSKFSEMKIPSFITAILITTKSKCRNLNHLDDLLLSWHSWEVVIEIVVNHWCFPAILCVCFKLVCDFECHVFPY